MAGYPLARSGVSVIVLEKHKDFFRDFRGDTVHPSTCNSSTNSACCRAFSNSSSGAAFYQRQIRRILF